MSQHFNTSIFAVFISKGAIIVCKTVHKGDTEELSLAFGPLAYLFNLMLVFISFKNNKGHF